MKNLIPIKAGAAEFWRGFKKYYQLKPVELTKEREEQILGYVKAQTRRMANVYSLRPDQAKDFSQRLFAKIFAVTVDRWQPGKGANIYSYAQSVGELTKCNIARELVKEHNRELDLNKVKRATALSGERLSAKRDWENDDAGDDADITASLTGGSFADQFAAMDVKLDWEYSIRVLDPFGRRVADLLWELNGNIAAVRDRLGISKSHKRVFMTRVILPIRKAFSERYLGLAKGELYDAQR